MRTFFSLLLLSLAVACGESGDDGGNRIDAAPERDDGGNAIDAAPGADAFQTICGSPGDEGNSLGIGRFCDSLGDCLGTPDAPLCAILGDPLAHFCTKRCDPEDDECGEDTACECDGDNCGCTPNACL